MVILGNLTTKIDLVYLCVAGGAVLFASSWLQFAIR